MSQETNPLNVVGGADPYRQPAPDESPPPSMDQMLKEMGASVEKANFDKGWEAKVYWMSREHTRVAVSAHGGGPQEAVERLYSSYRRMLQEGWRRTG